MKPIKKVAMASFMVTAVPAIWLAGMSVVNAKEDPTRLHNNSTEQPIRLIDECYLQEPGDVINRVPEIIPIDDCDGGGGGGGGGPYSAPSVPPSISYAPYTNSNQMRVSWGSSNGHGYGVQYELYESKNNGAWTKVYTGYSRSRLLTNKTKGKYRYRIMAKNTKYSSSYRYGNYTLVNPRQDDNLYVKYPSIMSTMDQKNHQYRTSSSPVKTSLKRTAVMGQSSEMRTQQNRFYLGDGFDLIRGALKETCLDVNHPNFLITKTPPLQPSTFDISYVNDNRHLAQLLEVSASAQIGFTEGDNSVGLSGEQERYSSSTTDEDYVRFVVKVNNRREFWKLNTPVDAIYPELVSNVLSPNDNEAKADFRERCGDNFISNANLGSALYLVFKFSSKKYSYQERENAKAELSAKLFGSFSASGSAGSSSSLNEVLSRLDVKINADQVGGPFGLAASITPSNVMQKYNQFVQDTNSDNWAAVDYTTSNYQRPTVYNSYTHEQIFAKYTGNQGPLAQMKRWLDISVQHKERCLPYEEYEQSTNLCYTSSGEISSAMDLCRETREWDNCVHPYQYNTRFPSNTTSGTYLLGWLSTNVKKLSKESNSESYNHHVHRDTKNVDDRTCLSSTQCFTNKFRGSGPGIGKGFHYYHGYYDNHRNGGDRSYAVYPQHCARTQVYLKTGSPPFGDTTSDWNYSVTVEGLCPVNQDFIVIP